VTEETVVDVATLLDYVVANFVANVCAGALFGALAAALAWWVCQELNIFQWVRERTDRRELDIRRAIHYLELLSAELVSLLEQIPRWREALKGLRWGTVFRIPTPAWELAQQNRELADLVDPQLLRGLIRFYEGLTDAERWLPLVAQSWLASDNDVESLEGKRTAIIGMAVAGLDQAEEIGDELAHRLEAEIERLKGLLPPSTGGKAPAGRSIPFGSWFRSRRGSGSTH
jgi:hypothetical protein